VLSRYSDCREQPTVTHRHCPGRVAVSATVAHATPGPSVSELGLVSSLADRQIGHDLTFETLPVFLSIVTALPGGGRGSRSGECDVMPVVQQMCANVSEALAPSIFREQELF
jgi:hypothetical protein